MTIKIVNFIILTIIWLGLTGVPNSYISLFFLILIPLSVTLIASKFALLPQKHQIKISAIYYFIWLLKEIFMSSLAVSKIAWRKNLRIQPILEPIITTQNTDIGKVIYANSITLTPGTVTLSTDNNHLLVHALDISFIDDLKTGEMDEKIKNIIIKK